MWLNKLDWSAQGWPRVFLWTILGTLGCIAAATWVDSFNFATLDDKAIARALLTDIGLPTLLAAPLIFFFSSKLRELAIANHRMSILAATDSLTGVLNRGAFTMLVDAYLKDARQQQRQATGALLIVDADEFKSINDTFGHDRGDQALRLIAQSIKAVLRGADIVGRIGGEEFGIFMPGATPQQAQGTAERIRVSVSVAEFIPGTTDRRPLSVSIGGATFDRSVPFGELFRLADTHLYLAKQAGRNRVSLTALAGVSAAA